MDLIRIEPWRDSLSACDIAPLVEAEELTTVTKARTVDVGVSLSLVVGAASFIAGAALLQYPL